MTAEEVMMWGAAAIVGGIGAGCLAVGIFAIGCAFRWLRDNS